MLDTDHRPADRLTGHDLLADLDRRRAENLNRPSPSAAMPVWDSQTSRDWWKHPAYGTHDANGNPLAKPPQGPR